MSGKRQQNEWFGQETKIARPNFRTYNLPVGLCWSTVLYLAQTVPNRENFHHLYTLERPGNRLSTLPLDKHRYPRFDRLVVPGSWFYTKLVQIGKIWLKQPPAIDRVWSVDSMGLSWKSIKDDIKRATSTTNSFIHSIKLYLNLKNVAKYFELNMLVNFPSEYQDVMDASLTDNF